MYAGVYLICQADTSLADNITINGTGSNSVKSIDYKIKTEPLPTKQIYIHIYISYTDQRLEQMLNK